MKTIAKFAFAVALLVWVSLSPTRASTCGDGYSACMSACGSSMSACVNQCNYTCNHQSACMTNCVNSGCYPALYACQARCQTLYCQ